MQGSSRSISHSNVRNSPTLYASFISGASGAVPSALSRSRGITSITHNGTGNYTVVFDRGANDFCDFDATNEVVSSPGVTKSSYGIVWSQALNTSAKSFTFQMCRNSDGAATDPASGDIVRFKIVLKYSTGLS